MPPAARDLLNAHPDARNIFWLMMALNPLLIDGDRKDKMFVCAYHACSAQCRSHKTSKAVHTSSVLGTLLRTVSDRHGSPNNFRSLAIEAIPKSSVPRSLFIILSVTFRRPHASDNACVPTGYLPTSSSTSSLSARGRLVRRIDLREV